MTDRRWHFGPSGGELLVVTGVSGPAARLGHRLTIAMTAWSATVSWVDGAPSDVELTVETGSLQVLRGRGGVTPLSAPEKALARVNALKSLDAKKFPQISYRTSRIEKADGGYLLTGVLEIHGTSRERVIDLAVEDRGDSWRLSCSTAVSQSDVGVKPYSLMMGALKVADEVTVTFAGVRARGD